MKKPQPNDSRVAWHLPVGGQASDLHWKQAEVMRAAAPAVAILFALAFVGFVAFGVLGGAIGGLVGLSSALPLMLRRQRQLEAEAKAAQVLDATTSAQRAAEIARMKQSMAEKATS